MIIIWKHISQKNILGFFIRVHTSCTHICRKRQTSYAYWYVTESFLPLSSSPRNSVSGYDNTFFSPLYQKPTFPMHRPNLIYSQVYSLTNVLDYIICVENIVGMKNTRGSVTSGCNDESGLTSCQCSQLKQSTGEWQMLNSELLTLTL